MLNETLLIEQLLQGNEKAFETIFKSYYETMSLFAMRYVQSQAIAEEITQEVFVKLWSKQADIKINSSLKSYLYGAIRNACLNHLKHQKVVQEHVAFELHNNATQVDDVVEYNELQEAVDSAIAKLPEKCREVFEMSRFEGKKYKDIAEALQISVKTVENQMGKALKVLRNELKDNWFILFILLSEI